MNVKFISSSIKQTGKNVSFKKKENITHLTGIAPFNKQYTKHVKCKHARL